MNIKKLLVYIGLFFLILAMLFFFVALPVLIPHTLTSAQKQNNVNSNTQRRQTATVASIFLNNYMIAAFALFPFAGAFFVDIVMFNTGRVVASYNLPAYWIMTSPFGWLELGADSFALLSGCQIFVYYLKRKTLRFWPSTLKTILTTLGITGIILFISAVCEFLSIKG